MAFAAKIHPWNWDPWGQRFLNSLEENNKLNSKDVGLRVSTIDEKNIWLRYNNPKIKIYMMENPLENQFYKNHYLLMKNAKVFKWRTSKNISKKVHQKKL